MPIKTQETCRTLHRFDQIKAPLVYKNQNTKQGQRAMTYIREKDCKIQKE